MKTLFAAALALACSGALASDVYKATLTRKGQDLYEVQGQNVIVQTRFCYEFVVSDEAILRIDSIAGYTVGKVFFSNGSSCDIAKILK